MTKKRHKSPESLWYPWPGNISLLAVTIVNAVIIVPSADPSNNNFCSYGYGHK